VRAVNRAEQISQDLRMLAIELPRVSRTNIKDRQSVLLAIYELETIAMHWLAEAQV
jgi:hypothetical protein